jgi:NitT/TauT family transport system substrate-binding protein
VVGLLIACSSGAVAPSPAPPPSAGAGGAERSAAGLAAAAPPPTAAPLKSVRVAMTSTGGTYLPHRIAQVQGFNREAGFETELLYMGGNTLFAGLVAGEIDYVDSGGSGIRAAGSGLPVRLAMCHGIRFLYYLVLASDVGAVRALEGKGVGVASLGGDNELVARDVIGKLGGDPSRIEFVSLGATNVRYAAVAANRIGGAIVSSPEAVLARKAGLTIASTPADLPPACNASVVVSQTAIAERPQEIRGFARAVQRAVEFMQTERLASARIQAEWQQLDEQDSLAAYDESQYALTFSVQRADGELAIQNSIAYARASGDFTHDVQVGEVADLSLAP